LTYSVENHGILGIPPGTGDDNAPEKKGGEFIIVIRAECRIQDGKQGKILREESRKLVSFRIPKVEVLLIQGKRVIDLLRVDDKIVQNSRQCSSTGY